MTTRRRRGPARATLAGVGVAVLLLGGCTAEPEPASPGPSAASTPESLDDLDLTALRALREPFCAAVTGEAVHAALGGEPTGSSSYVDGDRVAVARGLDDVVHEHGCTWTGAEGAVARAWVFAPPVPVARARAITRARVTGCDRDGDGFGTVGAAWTCDGRDGRTERQAGLVGDAWLTCEVTVPDPVTAEEAAARSDHWCAAVVAAASPDGS